MKKDKFACPRKHELGQPMSHNGPDTWVQDRCSYCGSLNPELFMEFLRAERIMLGTTTKDYKVYVNYPREDDEKKYGFTKFYFQHLDSDQRREFVELYNHRKISLDMGGFTVFPFFMKSTDPANPNPTGD